MSTYTIALFGEAERGEFETGYLCRSLGQLVDYLGNPPSNSRGLHYAVQALLYHRDLIFFRVREEGYSIHDYMSGVELLEKQDLIRHIAALCLPGVGDNKIIRVMTPYCQTHHSILITTEADLYDYLTDHP